MVTKKKRCLTPHNVQRNQLQTDGEDKRYFHFDKCVKHQVPFFPAMKPSSITDAGHNERHLIPSKTDCSNSNCIDKRQWNQDNKLIY